jgi:predicted anti-sigma-YlaC factor YlaD
MLKCIEVTELCSQELDRPLQLGERMSLQAHLMMCAGCRNFRRQMSSLRNAARAYAEGKGPAHADEPGSPLRGGG